MRIIKRFTKGVALLTTIVTLVFVMPACKKSNKNDGPNEQPGKITGLGEMAGVPTGSDFALPANISLAGSIFGSDCDSTYERGSGELVDVCVAFFNGSSTEITLTIPAGLFILAENAGDNQHGIVLQETKILLKAKAVTRVSLGAFCVNAHKSGSSRDKKYNFGKITDSKLIRELIALLAGKKINMEDYGQDYSGYYDATDVAQEAIWAITDFEGLTAEIKSQIAALPNK